MTPLSSRLLVAVAALTTAVVASGTWADPWESKPKDKPAGKPDAKRDDDARKRRDEAKKVFGPAAAADAAVPEDQAWTIALVVFRGENADELAQMALTKVQTEGGLPGAFLERRGEAVLVAVGRFESVNSPRATAEVKRVQEMTVAGQKPYKDALLVPPLASTNLGAMPEINLVQAKAMFGSEALYSLQVAVYGRRDLTNPTEADLAEARKAAEQAAVRLRQEGEQAFYYHGPRMSMVTIGVFGIDDFDPQTPSYKSARLLAAQKRHPYNLYNGAGIKEKRNPNSEGKLQPSNLVALPEK